VPAALNGKVREGFLAGNRGKAKFSLKQTGQIAST
jgi:hypothetical protein